MFDQRIIVVGLVWNQAGELLLCRMDPDSGLFPGEWGLPGGGMEPGERIGDALKREIEEELAIEVNEITPAIFKDGAYLKKFPDGTTQMIYMIFLVFHCRAVSEEVRLNREFVDYHWVPEADVSNFDLNQETADTLSRIGWGKGLAGDGC